MTLTKLKTVRRQCLCRRCSSDKRAFFSLHIPVLLSKNQLLPALRFVRGIGAQDTISARKFLEAASNTKDKMTFFSIFKFFEQRNVRLRGKPQFPPGEHCEKYVKEFDALFSKDRKED